MIDEKWLQDIFEKIDKKIEAECERLGDKIPYIPKDGKYVDMADVNLSFWTNGFWGGILWQMYHATKKELYAKTANVLEERLDLAIEQYDMLHHDVGFQWLHTAVANYRLTGNPKSRIRGLHAANLLAGRYNPRGKFINAWNRERSEWMIIDCLMNLPLLYWANLEEAGLVHYTYIAEEHADTTLSKLLRADGSCYHIGEMNPATGEVNKYDRGQGYDESSSWTRGASWAIYGFALNYHYSNKKEYLDAAKKAAHYFIANVMHTGYVPLVDFRQPQDPNIYDTTAGAIAACGMLEIAKHVSEQEKEIYLDAARLIIEAIESKHADWDIDTDGIIGSGTVAYHKRAENETEVPIIYGDYFFIEAILRLKGLNFLIW